jgi:hypothetical protein
MWSKIFGSSRVWAALLAIVFIVLYALMPGLPPNLSQGDVTSAVIALALFIVAETVTGGSVGWAIFVKPRFWALVVSLAFIFIRAFVPGFFLSETSIQELIAAIGAASVGVSYRPIGVTKT